MSDRSVRPGPIAGIWLSLLGVVLVAAAFFFTIGGARLLMLGGSAYFLIAGLALLLSGGLIVARRPVGALIFGLVYVATVVWAVWEVGFTFWPLNSRLLAITVGAVAVAISYPVLRRFEGRTPMRAPSFAIAGVLAVGAVAGFAGMFVPHAPVAFKGAVPDLFPEAEGAAASNWSAYGHDAANSRFVGLNQINRDNVNQLKVAWTYRTGDVAVSDGNGAEDQNTPLQIGDTLYVCTPHNNVIALNADTGREKWKTMINAKSSIWQRCRGLAYFDAAAPLQQPTIPGATAIPAAVLPQGAACRRRLFVNTIDARLIAIDADTGALCPDFGANGVVDLKAGMGAAPDPQYQLTSAPTLAGTTVVVGGRVADNVQVNMPGGVMRGFDVITGQMRWAFDPGNPQDKAVPAAGKTYVRSTPNNWAGMTYDAASNTVFAPMGSSSVDVYGATRTPLDHRYGASMLAIDATTGQEKWHYQTVHNDLWDFDIPMAPTLIDFPVDGATVPALVFGTKAGQIYVLDRATGRPLTEVVEQPVKAANIPGEPYSLTQPRSVGMPQIGAQTLKEADMWGATPFDQLLCRISFKSMRYEGLYTAPGTDLSLSFPGSLGGMNWGGLSVDPNSQTIYANDMRLGLWSKMLPQAPQTAGQAGSGGEAVNAGMGAVPMKGTPYAVDKNRFLSALGIPCQSPPFGTLTAIDMKTRAIKWQVPVGTVQDPGPMGIRMGLPIPVGMPTLGGALTTQGGLVFIAGTQDFYLRAFNSGNGKEVWKARRPVGSQGGPISYRSPVSGKQYVVVTAGGARQSPDRGDYVIAYRLP